MVTKQEFEKLYKENYSFVYFTALQLMGNAQDAEDITQETFISAFMKYAELKDEANFHAWVKRIAINRCLDQLRKRNPVPTEDSELELMVDQENDENFLQEDYVLNEEKRKIVMKIMKSVLSEKQYQTVVLFYYDELPVSEIADMLRVPEGTVLSRLSASRAKIKKGVLEYEKKNNDKLHSLIMLPFLTRLLQAEAAEIIPPAVLPEPIDNAISPDKTYLMNSAKIAEKGLAMSKLKLVLAGVITVPVVTVGIIAAVKLSGGKENTDKLPEVPQNQVSVNVSGTNGEVKGIDAISDENPEEDNRLYLTDEELSYTDYPSYHKDGKLYYLLRVYNNNTDKDIELKYSIDYSFCVHNDMIFIPAHGYNTISLSTYYEKDMNKPEDVHIEVVPYLSTDGKEYDRQSDYNLQINKTLYSLDSVLEYIGDDPNVFDTDKLYYAVFYDNDNNILDVSSWSFSFSGVQKGAKAVGLFYASNLGDGLTYDHYEIYSSIDRKKNHYADNNDVSIKEVTTGEWAGETQLIFEVENSSDTAKEVYFSAIGYDSQENIAATCNYVNIEAVEPGEIAYVSEKPDMWQEGFDLDNVARWEKLIIRVTDVDEESSSFNRNLKEYFEVDEDTMLIADGSYTTMSYVNIKNNGDVRGEIHICILFYDSNNNIVTACDFWNLVQPGTTVPGFYYINKDKLDRIDHHKIVFRAREF